jgi:phage tail sheath protein FI
MATYKTPGVYVEEITTLPPSVAEVETAIPAFIGYTETGIAFSPKRISSLVEYQQFFGSAQPETSISVTIAKGDGGAGVAIDAAKRSKNVMYYALQLYFANGGGPCYIVSTGAFADGANASLDVYTGGLATLEKEDEPTLLVFPDAPLYLDAKHYYALANAALLQCEKLGDRFTIIDVVDTGGLEKSKADFRNAISSNREEAKYGAAYYPYLTTDLSYNYDEASITVTVADDPEKAKKITDADAKAKVARADATAVRADADQKAADSAANAGDKNLEKAASDANKKAKTAEDKATQAEQDADTLRKGVASQAFNTLSNAQQNQVKQKIRDLAVTMTPCAAIAGVYANTDNTRGVWKAPANVSLSFVDGPLIKITDEDQKDLNIDTVAGKSINAIRSFKGKGTIVWGARTLTGNDNEWRYVNVRRFFNMVEESVKRSTHWAVFEPNDSNTWVLVRAMIENYLILKWKEGALAGTKPEDAFFVHVGLGTTMTAEDVLEGRMNVEIGMAAVRPAEFIILKFSHKLQVS